jgi:hypothetical protein
MAGFLWTVPAHGQLSVGVAAGGTYSDMGGSLITATDSDWGVLLGGSVRFRYVTNLALQLEGNWVQKGGRGTVEGVARDLDLDYFEIPLTAQLVVGLSPKWDWNLYGGIALAFKTTCEVTTGSSEKESCDNTVPDWTIESTEWSVPFGTSFSYRLARSAVTADLRYSYGLSAAVKNLDLKNRSWQFIVRWGFEV